MSKIKPALEAGKIVITDRFHMSSLVYQGYARGLGIDKVRALNDFVCDFYPDLNIVIDIPVQVSMQRKQNVEDINRLDLEGEAFHKKVEEAYKMICESRQDPTVIIDGTVPIDEMIQTIFLVIKEHLEKKNE